MPVSTIKKRVVVDGKTIEIGTKPKTITIDIDHQYYLHEKGIKLSKIVRDMINDLIREDPKADQMMREYYEGIMKRGERARKSGE